MGLDRIVFSTALPGLAVYQPMTPDFLRLTLLYLIELHLTGLFPSGLFPSGLHWV